METTNADEPVLPPLGRRNTRTDTSDGGAEVGQDGGTSITHLTLDGELSLDVDLADQSPDHEGGDTGKKENGREYNDRNELCEHAQTHREDGVKVVGNRTIDCNHCQPRFTRHKIRGLGTPDCIS